MSIRSPAILWHASKSRHLVIDGSEVQISFHRNARARRIVLRVSPGHRGIRITLPPGVSERSGLDFAIREARWIKAQLAHVPERRPFAPDTMLPLRGRSHRLAHRPGQRGTAWCEDTVTGPPLLCVAGPLEHFPRRVEDWLKTQARTDLLAASEAYAHRMNVRFKRLALRDQRSRWGSCSATGALSYSWRLVLAPPFVLDYVAAHEVAHLVEMNHGPDFWTLVHGHCLHTDEARHWLKRHGAGLHHYGA